MDNVELEKLITSIICSSDFKIISKVNGGMMNESYLFSYNEKEYIIYIPFGNANNLVNRKLEKDNQKICVNLNITSKNIYFDSDTGIKVNEFIKGNSLDKINEYDINKVADLLKTLHNSSVKSKEDYNPFIRFINYENDRLKVFNNENEYQILRDYLFSNTKFLNDNLFLVLSHNDAQKSNIVLGSDNKYYLIDFEFMANNDEVYDIATFGNGLVKEGFELLKAYYKDLDDVKIKKYYLYRLFISLQWYNVAISKHYNNEGAMHGYDFLMVAKHFLDNAKECYNNLNK